MGLALLSNYHLILIDSFQVDRSIHTWTSYNHWVGAVLILAELCGRSTLLNWVECVLHCIWRFVASRLEIREILDPLGTLALVLAWWIQTSRSLSHTVHGHELHSKLAIKNSSSCLSAQYLLRQWFWRNKDGTRLNHLLHWACPILISFWLLFIANTQLYWLNFFFVVTVNVQILLCVVLQVLYLLVCVDYPEDISKLIVLSRILQHTLIYNLFERQIIVLLVLVALCNQGSPVLAGLHPSGQMRFNVTLSFVFIFLVLVVACHLHVLFYWLREVLFGISVALNDLLGVFNRLYRPRLHASSSLKCLVDLYVYSIIVSK